MVCNNQFSRELMDEITELLECFCFDVKTFKVTL